MVSLLGVKACYSWCHDDGCCCMCTSVALVTRRMYDLIVSTLLASTRFAVCANQQTKTSFDVPESVSERLMDAEWMTFPIKNRKFT